MNKLNQLMESFGKWPTILVLVAGLAAIIAVLAAFTKPGTFARMFKAIAAIPGYFLGFVLSIPGGIVDIVRSFWKGLRVFARFVRGVWKSGKWGKFGIILTVVAIGWGGQQAYLSFTNEDKECFNSDFLSLPGEGESCSANNVQVIQVLKLGTEAAHKKIISIAQHPVSVNHPAATPIRITLANKGTVDVEFASQLDKQHLLDYATSAGYADLQTLRTLPLSRDWVGILVPVLGFALLFGLMGLAQHKGWLKPGGGIGKNKAKLVDQSKDRKTFDDVYGHEEAKESCQDIIDFLRDPQKFLGCRIPRGVLLVGPPGTGKTLLARAIAGEANVPFFTISGSDFVEMFVGVGASRVRDMFEQAKKNAPCIIFVDEIDAVGRHRGAGTGGGNDEREQTLNQLLVEMDGFEQNEGIVLIAATNRPDVLDPALLRPKRFDRQIELGNPTIIPRERTLEDLFEKNAQPGFNAKKWASLLYGASYADIENLDNEAKILARKRGRVRYNEEDFKDAFEKITYGEKKVILLTDEEKRLTAGHEGGHALTAMNYLEPYGELVRRGTIVPRRRALGMISMSPDRDPVSTYFGKIKAWLIVAMAGRAAEYLMAGGDESKISSGAQGDIAMATQEAEKAITLYGFAPIVDRRLALLKYAKQEQDPFLGLVHASGTSVPHSQEEIVLVRGAIAKLASEAWDEALQFLRDNGEQWVVLSNALFEFETMSREEMFEKVNDWRKDHGLEPYIVDRKVEDNDRPLQWSVLEQRLLARESAAIEKAKVADGGQAD